MLGMAAGDALGAGYEFTDPSPDAPIIMKGGGGFGWAPGEWTDDTQMAICVAEEAASGLLNPAAVGDRFLEWLRSGPADVGVMTRAVLGSASSGKDLPAAAEAYCRSHPRSAGNGSLMRTAPVALAHLGDQPGIAEAARSVSDLTHADPLAGDACVLWCIAIDHAVNAAEFDLRSGLEYLPDERRATWEKWINEAETADPQTFTPNGYVVTALQAAWAAITQTPIPSDRPAHHLRDALVAAVRIGHDTDTVAAIAGSLLGARWGSTAIPLGWKALLHGWPGHDARDLTRLAVVASRKPDPDASSNKPVYVPLDKDDTSEQIFRDIVGAIEAQAKGRWPEVSSMLPHYRAHNPHEPVEVALLSDPGVTIGNALAAAETKADVIISLCRMGSEPLRPDGRHVDVLLLDDPNPDANPNLLSLLEDTADAISAWRADDKTVYLHCVEAQNRTPTMAVAYLIRRFGMKSDEALTEVTSVLGNGPSNIAFREALPQIAPTDPSLARSTRLSSDAD